MKLVAHYQQTSRFDQTDRAAKPAQRFFIRGFISEILDDDQSTLDETSRCVSYRFVQWMNVVKRANEQDCIKMAVTKIRPCSNARIHAELTSSGDRITVAVDYDHCIPVLRQARRHLALPTADL
ncbi:MAG TPA: hypothetical protein VKH14_00100 [Candidatus Udaeobacter sp.]|nr:hypothetical protein [Candidatus Udaeobacter sp.]